MAYLEWTENLSVGVESLDEDHRKLVALINRVFESMEKSDNADEVGSVLDELIEYTHYHFSREEGMMRLHEYPELDEHAQVHADLTRQVEEFRDRFRANPGGFKAMEVFDFLSQWLMRHIIGRDLKYKPYLGAG